MISLGNDTILRYRQFLEWADTLRDMDDRLWTKPIADGKATVADIVSHLQHWDYYLLHTVIPSIKNGEDIRFPDFDSYNEQAYEYARSGVSKDKLLDELTQTRLRLIELLRNEPDVAAKHVPVNGVARCPHTDTPYSLLYIVYEFIDHDAHHKNQILSVI
ncbi:DinB family protein [Cohnella sp. GCM10027633]|uniref:DinB family protein n=1 Tax=unclassified Cohnella TaxID=2636738 RepID=UPI003636F756